MKIFENRIWRHKVLLIGLLIFYYYPIKGQKLSAGYSTGNVFYICEDSTISAVGSNYNGELGDGTNISRRFPVKVKGLQSITAIDGVGHLALKSDGTVWQWYRHENYSLQKIPLDSVVWISSSLSSTFYFRVNYFYYCAVRSDGTVWVWGDSPKIEPGYWGYTDTIKKVDIANVKQVEAGVDCVVALCKDSSVWTWGSKLVDGNGGDTAGLRYSYVPEKVKSLDNIIDIAAGSYVDFALKDDGTVWAWGTHIDLPEHQISFPTKLNISEVKSIYNELWMFAAIKQDGTLYKHDNSWSFNDGNLEKVDLMDNAKEVAINGWNTFTSTYVLKNDGTLWRWGDNAGGQLGNFTNFPIESPEVMPRPCTAVDCDTITKKPDVLKLDDFVFPGLPVKLKASPSEADLYWWYPRTNIINGVYNQEATVTIKDDTEFTAVIMDSYGCMRKERFMLHKKCDTIPKIILDTIANYPGERITLEAGNGYSHLWSPLVLLNCYGCQNVTAIVNDSITYTATYSDTYWCKTKEKFIIRMRDCDTIINNNDFLIIDSLITPGQSILLKAPDAKRYKWTPTIGLNCDTCQNAIARIYDNTEYSVTLTDKYLCRWTERFRLTNNCDNSSLVNPKLILDTITYPNNQINFKLPLGLDYSWQPVTGLNCTDCYNPTATIYDSIQYIASRTDSFNCHTKEKYIIRIRNCDTIQWNKQVLRLDTVIHYTTEIPLNLSKSYNGYLWNQTNGLNCSDCQNPTLIASGTSDYIVEMYDTWRCPFKEEFKITLVLLDVIIPNVFTPNGDGINDYFEITGLMPGSKLKVFDSKGGLVFTSDNYNSDWDGKNNKGEQLEEGTYWYIIIIPEKDTFKGWVYIKR